MMKKMVIKVESLEEMLERIDTATESCTRSFEEPEDLLSLFTPARRALLGEIQIRPGSIKDIALRLQRDANDVEQDIRALADAEVVTVKRGWVRPVAEEIVFEPIPQTAATC